MGPGITCLLLIALASAASVTTNANSFLIDGQPRLLRGGSIQWMRTSPELWRDRVAKFKGMGYNTVDMYAAWRDHEPIEGQFDFKTKDIKKFLSLCQEYGLWVYLRPGPYITNEMDGGGVPQWVMAKSTKLSRDPDNNDGMLNLRTNDKDYIDAVRRYYTALMQEINGFLFDNGGPIILVGIENEFTWGAQFFEYDKYSMLPNGTWERPLNQTIDTVGYLTHLRDIMLENGVKVPIATCPGDGTVSATGNVSGIIPIPNLYSNIPQQYSAWSLLADMHNPANHNGVYINYPSGITETDRSVNSLRSSIMAGLDAIFQFNVIGFHQEGYQNAILINGGGTTTITEAIDRFANFSLSETQDLFLAPPIGFVGNTLDYNGAISPSGVLREKYHQIRRTNLFFNDFETMIAAAGEAKRSVYRIWPEWLLTLFGYGPYAGQDLNVMVFNKNVGSPDQDLPNERVNYFLNVGPNSAFISLYNDFISNGSLVLGSRAIRAFGVLFPKFTSLTVPAETCSSNITDFRRYTMILPVNVVLPTSKIRIRYSTSEILTSRAWGIKSSLLVLYGADSTEGEISFGNAHVQSHDDSIFVFTSNTVATYTHSTVPQKFTVKSSSGSLTHVVIINTYLAGKCWFPAAPVGSMICGLDYLDESFDYQLPVEVSAFSKIPIYTFASDDVSGYSMGIGHLNVYTSPGSMSSLTLSQNTIIPAIRFASARSISDYAESTVKYNDSTWIRLGNTPRALEYYDSSTGHSWYRATFTIPTDLVSKGFTPSLYVPFAADFVGIYLNGHYITSVNPIGTEINSISEDIKYSFEIPTDYVVEGINTLAFRTEVWGHGSFMWIRGTLMRWFIGGMEIDFPSFTKCRVPSLGYDSLKGLEGNVTFSGLPVANWTLRHHTDGEQIGFMNLDFDDRLWYPRTLPSTLSPGEIVWYRFELNATQLPDAKRWNGPLNIRLQGSNTKANLYLNGRLFSRWISDVNWISRGTWAKSLRGPWSNADEDETPIDRALLLETQTNVLAIQFEDMGTLRNPGVVNSVEIIVSQNENQFVKKDTGGHVLSPISVKLPVNFF